MATQVDAARAGMELLEGAQKTLAKMQTCYQVCMRAPHTLPKPAWQFEIKRFMLRAALAVGVHAA